MTLSDIVQDREQLTELVAASVTEISWVMTDEVLTIHTMDA